MKTVYWKQSENGRWHLYDGGSKQVGEVYYIEDQQSKFNGLFGGIFCTSDDRQVRVEVAGTAVLQAKAKIQDNYLLDRSYDWWMT